MNQCPCTRTTQNGYLCTTCTTNLHTMLNNVPGLIEDLTITATRQDHISTASIRAKSDDSPLPVNLAATWATQRLTKAIDTTWRLSQGGPAYRYEDTAEDRAAAANNNLDNLIKQPAVIDAYTQLQAAVEHATTTIDRRPERIHLGACAHTTTNNDGQKLVCDNPLWATPDDVWLHCDQCGTTWDIKARQRDAISAAWNVLADPPAIVRALQSQQIPITMKRFENWVQLGHLNPVMADKSGRKLYRVSDAFKVHLKMAARRRGRKAS